MAQNQTWVRTDAAKLSYHLDKQIESGSLETEALNVVTYPSASALPSTFTSSTYNPRNGDGSEVIIVSGVPFKINGTWGFSANDTEEATEGLFLTKCKRILVRIDTGAAPTLATGQRAYIIPSSGLVTNDANGATNNYIGTFWTNSADYVKFDAGALAEGDCNSILPNGSYAWIEFEGSQASPAS